MHLAIHTQYYPPEMGAPQARLSELAGHFTARGHRVSVLTSMPNYPLGRIYEGYGGVLQRELLDGASVVRSYIYPTKRVAMLHRMANYLSFVASSALIGTVALNDVDYLLTESPPLFLGMSGYLLSRLKHSRWIFNVSDLWPESAVHLGVVGEGSSLRFAYWLEAFCYRHAWLVTGQSREILENIQARFPDVNTYHLSNGVDTSRFRPEAYDDQVRSSLGSPGKVIAMYAGLHGIAQGLDQLMAAAAKLQDLPQLQIVLVGDGPEKERLMAEARDLGNVSFLDPRPRHEIPALLASSDIALVPLRQRLPGAVPSKLYEGMASGLPIVLVAEGEAADIVTASEAGEVVQPGDTERLALVLRTLTQDAARRQQYGEHARTAALARFDRQKIAKHFIDFLESQ